jgi:hypothetical protein
MKAVLILYMIGQASCQTFGISLFSFFVCGLIAIGKLEPAIPKSIRPHTPDKANFNGCSLYTFTTECDFAAGGISPLEVLRTLANVAMIP